MRRSGRRGAGWVLLFFFLLLGLAVLWKFRIQDVRPASAELEHRVNRLLLAAGVGDKDVLFSFRRERREIRWFTLSGRRWIESHKRIRLSPRQKASLAEALRKNISGEGYEIEEKPNGVVLSLRGVSLMTLLFEPPLPLPAPTRGLAAIVIDDLGYQPNEADEFLSLPLALTFAILPRERHSKSLSQKIAAQGKTVMMHLPMEPYGYPSVNPGKAALLVSMSEEEIARRFAENLKTVPEASGVNNHMGSRFTENAAAMERVLPLIKNQRLFFLDSLTSQKSEGFRLAQKMLLPSLRNDVFLDNQDELHYIEGQLRLLIERAGRQGRAVAIGHVHKKHLAQALKNVLPEFEKAGVRIVSAKDLAN